MFQFPKDLYTDVRIEDVFETTIRFTLDNIDEMKVRKYKAAFIRIFDGDRWYYSALSDVDMIQDKINTLAQSAKPNPDIYENPVVRKFQVNKGKFLKFADKDIVDVKKEDKLELLKSYFPIWKKEPSIKMCQSHYIDHKTIKTFYSSKGADLTFDFQLCGFIYSLNFSQDDKKFDSFFMKASNFFDDLKNQESEFRKEVEKGKDFLLNAKPLEPGKYTVILSPLATGIFAHESFGHKSEADFMIGDETMKNEWAIGKKIGSDILSIVDDGNYEGGGYMLFDDEGTKSEKTYLIKTGILSGRLHNSVTASLLEENLTGNARASSFSFEPIVRMTTTYIEPGNKTKEEIFAGVKEGIFVDTVKHGSGMSTFTLAPNITYYIKDGQITHPVNVSVITGNVFETLGHIDAASNEIEIISFTMGGCGKMEQFPLYVAFGGPYIRVKDMNVQ